MGLRGRPCSDLAAWSLASPPPQKNNSPFTPQHEEEEEEERLQRGHSALQGLLRRLGAGFEDVFHTGASSAAGGGAYHPGNARVRAALGQLRSHDAGEQLAGLAELCEYLAVSTEESLLTFPVDTAVPLLVSVEG